MMNMRQHIRQPLEQPGKLAMTLIPFEKLEKRDITADAVDMGAGGLGITAGFVLEPGFVIIRDGIGEQKDGVLMWSKELNDTTYRAGIQFIQTRLKKTDYPEAMVQPYHSVPGSQNPGLVASILLDEIERP